MPHRDAPGRVDPDDMFNLGWDAYTSHVYKNESEDKDKTRAKTRTNKDKDKDKDKDKEKDKDQDKGCSDNKDKSE